MKKVFVALYCFLFSCMFASPAQATDDGFDATKNLVVIKTQSDNNGRGSEAGSSGNAYGRNFGIGNGKPDKGGANNDFAPIPEPATMLLVGVGLAGIATLKRRKKK